MKNVLFVLLPFLFAAVQPTIATCGPVLNELMADPASDWDGDGTYSFKNDEWVEVLNPGPGSLNLTGYYLTDEAGGFVFGLTGVLQAGEVAVVYGSQASAWEGTHGASTTGLRLGNEGDTCTIQQVVAGDTLVVDVYTYNNYEAEDDRSTGRVAGGGPTWEIYDALNPYSGTVPPLGNGLPPTPGHPNGTTPIPVQEQTWGRVKSLFAEH